MPVLRERGASVGGLPVCGLRDVHLPDLHVPRRYPLQGLRAEGSVQQGLTAPSLQLGRQFLARRSQLLGQLTERRLCAAPVARGRECVQRDLLDRGRALLEIAGAHRRSEEHTSELQSPCNLVCRLLLEKKKTKPLLQACARRAQFARQPLEHTDESNQVRLIHLTPEHAEPRNLQSATGCAEQLYGTRQR